MNHTCAKCGSDRIIPQAKVVDRGHHNWSTDLEVEVSINHKQSVFTREAYRASAYARICAGCGHIELYTDHTDGLWDAYQASLKQQ